MTPHEEIRNGEDARNLLESPIFRNAMDAVKSGLIGSMGASALGDTQTHNRLVIALQLLNQIEREIKRHVETGTIAQIQVNDNLGRKLKLATGF